MKALITGITGQDGSYLAEHLLSLGYEVHGMVRRSSTGNLRNIQHLLDKIRIHYGDMLDPISVGNIISLVEPEEIYNEADQDNVDFSYSTPAYSMAITAGAVANLLELVRVIDNSIRVFQPLSAMMFGNTHECPQSLDTEFNPQNPYGCAKVAAYHMCNHYRREHGLHVVGAILYNHESERRDEKYLLHMICSKAVKWAMGLSQEKIRIGNPEGFVDIGYAPEFVSMFPVMLNMEQSRNFLIGSDKKYLIHDLCQHALQMVGLEYEKCVVETESIRPGNFADLFGDNSSAKRILGYAPKTDAMSMVGILIGHYQRKYKPEKRNSK